MGYQFPPDVDRLIRDRMAQGGYVSEDDVLRDALRALEEISHFCPAPHAGKTLSFDRLREQVNQGLEQLNLGEGRDSEEVFAELLRDLPNPDQDSR